MMDNPKSQPYPLVDLEGALPPPEETPGLQNMIFPHTQVTILERQQKHIAALNSLLAAENDAHLLGQSRRIRNHSKREKSWHMFLRFFIAMILFVTIFWRTQMTSHNEPVSSPNKHVIAFQEILNVLPEKSQVLVVFDYEPAFTAELEPGIQSIFKILEEKKATITTISTIPNGPLVINHVMQTKTVKSSLDLGYLPGESLGLAHFAKYPTTLTATALPELKTIQDFNLIIVTSNEPGIVQNWLEQVQPFLGTTPFAAVISSQAAPTLQPYLESHQIQGWLAGAEEITSFQGLTPQNQMRWNGIVSGITIAIGLLILSFLINLLVLPIIEHAQIDPDQETYA